MRRGTVLLEPLLLPVEVIPLAELLPELLQRLNVAAGVDGHRTPVFIFEPERSDHAMLGQGDSRRALSGVGTPLAGLIPAGFFSSGDM